MPRGPKTGNKAFWFVVSLGAGLFLGLFVIG